MYYILNFVSMLLLYNIFTELHFLIFFLKVVKKPKTNYGL